MVNISKTKSKNWIYMTKQWTFTLLQEKLTPYIYYTDLFLIFFLTIITSVTKVKRQPRQRQLAEHLNQFS